MTVTEAAGEDLAYPAVELDGARVTALVRDGVLEVRAYSDLPVAMWVNGQPVTPGPAQDKPRGRHHRSDPLDSSQAS